MGRRPLGQHFLIRRSVVQRILAALELAEPRPVLEIGPGKGALTGPLAHHASQLLLIEKDPALAEEVKSHLEGKPSVEVLTADFLHLPWKEITTRLGENFRVVSNLPYQAATAILQRLLYHLPAESIMVLMFQKEVADRLTAQPHSKAYGSLTVVTQLVARVKTLCQVPPLAFRPPPQVDSTVLKFRMRREPLIGPEQMPGLEALLRDGFGHRRKMLRQNLRSAFGGAAAAQIEARLEAVGASPQARAEELSVEQWVDLYKEK